MEREIEAYDSCDWKEFMHTFILNLWLTLKAMICAICGIWTHIHKHECELDYLFNGASFSFGEDSTGESKLVAGRGVDFGIRKASQEHTSDVTMTYIAGGTARIYGSLRLFTESYKDVKGNTKNGNSVWNFTANDWAGLPSGGELLYELRISEEEYPQIKSIHGGDLFYTGGHNRFVQAHVVVFTSGDYAYGQHGWCDADGTPSASGYSSGHKVPDGFRYVQVRLNYLHNYYVDDVKDGSNTNKRGSDMTLAGNIGIRMNQDEIEC